jgi:hypothetical protein
MEITHCEPIPTQFNNCINYDLAEACVLEEEEHVACIGYGP